MRESDIRVLMSVGLSRTEAIIYLDLVRHPLSAPKDIAERCRIHRPNIYDSIKRLKKTGLVIENISVRGKKYSALEPEKLTLYLKQRESELNDLIEDLKKIPRIFKEERKIELLEGISIKKEFLDLIDSKKEALVFFNPKFDFTNLKFLKNLNEKRIKKKIPVRIIVSKDSAFKIKKIPYTSVKKADFKIPDVITIITDKVLYYLLRDSTLIKINNKNISLEKRIFFEYLWKRLD